MTNETTEPDDLARELIDSVAAAQTVLQDVLIMIAQANPKCVADLRDSTAAELQRHVDDDPDRPPMFWRGFWEKRRDLLEGAMVSVDAPHQTATIVSLVSMERASKDDAEHATNASL